jgi:hypothetical protein
MVYPALYAMAIGGSFSGEKAASDNILVRRKLIEFMAANSAMSLITILSYI